MPSTPTPTPDKKKKKKTKKPVKKGGMVIESTAATVERLESYKSVEGVMVCTRDGVPLSSTMDDTATTIFIEGLTKLERQATSMVRQFEPTNEILYMCLTTKKYEISMAPRRDHSAIVVQSRKKMHQINKQLQT